MRLNSLKVKLMISVSVLVIGSGMVISLLEAKHAADSLNEAAMTQGEYLSRAVALEATNKILINDLVSLQNLLNHQLESHSALAYLFIIKDGRVIANTFVDGMPARLVKINPVQGVNGSVFKRVVNEQGEYFLDFAMPIFSGKAGTLRIGLTEKPYRQQLMQLWERMIAVTLAILFCALLVSYYFIKRITEPLTALSQAAEEIDEKNLAPCPEPTGNDEVARLATAFNRMIMRIREHTRKLEKKADELDHAHQRTIGSLEIIRGIGGKSSLQNVSSYLINKFQEIMACSEMVFLVFGPRNKTIFQSRGNEIVPYKEDFYESTLTELVLLKGLTFLPKGSVSPRLVPESFRSASRIAAFPVFHECQFLGALLVPCPESCKCAAKEMDVISMILDHSSGAIKRAASHEEEMEGIRHIVDTTTKYCGIVGKDPKMQAIYKLIEDISPTDTTVLIQGESGTGKELVAGAIHRKSLRRKRPFVVINCSAYPATLLESELFGHEKGAFTGAVRRKIGRFEQADGGTVFLDEIGEIPPAAQIKLLRVLQTQKFERVGGEKTITVDVRIIAATNKELVEEVKRGVFREDLYYRLKVIPINIPPLRKRRNDIPLLARCFMKRFAGEQGKPVSEISPEVMRLLLDHPWPGNVRELENCIEHAAVLARGNRIEVSDLPSSMQGPGSTPGTGTKGSTIADNETKLLKEVLEACNWNKKQAALRLGISRNTLYRKLKKYHLHNHTIH